MASRLSNVVRRKFVDYFVAKHNHKYIKSCSIVPKDDRSLSFINAGMNQFKPLILADLEHYTPNRVCNYQKCVRVGGKMCDLSAIGHDFRHHTFFEMLGNWSFNDYGKAHACEWALDFLVNHMNLELDKITVTYYLSEQEEDLETKQIWLNLGLRQEKIVANKQGDNFWEMGESGPCGMSTEIFYPSGKELLEVWNLVFIDRQRVADSKSILPLKSLFIDTGLGFERLLSIIEKVESNYDTDLFRSLFKVIESKSNVDPYKGSLHNELDINYRIMVDHCRFITIALADGVMPGRRGAAFELRSIIKKTLLLSRDVFQQESPRYLIFDLVDEIVYILSHAYPDLPASVKHIRRTLASESKRYLTYLSKAEQRLQNEPLV